MARGTSALLALASVVLVALAAAPAAAQFTQADMDNFDPCYAGSYAAATSNFYQDGSNFFFAPSCFTSTADSGIKADFIEMNRVDDNDECPPGSGNAFGLNGVWEQQIRVATYRPIKSDGTPEERPVCVMPQHYQMAVATRRIAYCNDKFVMEETTGFHVSDTAAGTTAGQSFWVDGNPEAYGTILSYNDNILTVQLDATGDSVCVYAEPTSLVSFRVYVANRWDYGGNNNECPAEISQHFVFGDEVLVDGFCDSSKWPCTERVVEGMTYYFKGKASALGMAAQSADCVGSFSGPAP